MTDVSRPVENKHDSVMVTETTEIETQIEVNMDDSRDNFKPNVFVEDKKTQVVEKPIVFKPEEQPVEAPEA